MGAVLGAVVGAVVGAIVIKRSGGLETGEEEDPLLVLIEGVVFVRAALVRVFVFVGEERTPRDGLTLYVEPRQLHMSTPAVAPDPQQQVLKTRRSSQAARTHINS